MVEEVECVVAVRQFIASPEETSSELELEVVVASVILLRLPNNEVEERKEKPGTDAAGGENWKAGALGRGFVCRLGADMEPSMSKEVLTSLDRLVSELSEAKEDSELERELVESKEEELVVVEVTSHALSSLSSRACLSEAVDMLANVEAGADRLLLPLLGSGD